MIFTETKLKGAYLIDWELRNDERGFFTRSFCQHEFATLGLKTSIAQCNISFNKNRGTLRGMHFQITPRAEAKLVQCTRGAIYDVIIDLRPDSLSYCAWTGVELTADSHRMLYIPEGFAHGFQTLDDNVEVFYHMFEFYSPDHARGVRWDDPAFGVIWPLPNPIISERDGSYPLFEKR